MPLLLLAIILSLSCTDDKPTETDTGAGADTSPPSVAIVAPLAGSAVSDTVNIVAQVSDNVGVTKLEVVIDSTLYTTLISSPWQCEWDVTAYLHGSTRTLYVVAYDAAGNTATSAIITVTIGNPLIDSIPPIAITDLIVSDSASNTLTLSWTAPGNDGSTGTATNYDIRYSSSEITEQNFLQATPCTGVPSPKVAGSTESFVVTGLLSNETYYFAIKSGDATPNISDLSNIVIGITKGDLFTGLTSYLVYAGSYPTARSIVSADFDGDGYPDIAAAANSGVSVLFNNGAGVFGAPAYYDLGVNTREIISGDFDGDGVLDLAVAWGNGISESIGIMLNSGGGSFQGPLTYALTSLPREICTADLNGNGILDLAIAHDNYVGGVLETGVDVLLGNGNGTFQQKINYVVEGSPWSVSAGDFDGDDVNDLVVSCYNFKMVWVLLNNGNGTFQNAVNVLQDEGGNHSTAVIAADFNADGFDDIAATNDYPDYVTVLLGNDDGTFDIRGNYRVGNLPADIAMADFDGDGIADLATPGNNDGNASVILGNGDGSFQSSLYFPVAPVLWEINTADYDQDGDFDLALLQLAGSRVYILFNSTIP